MEFRRITHDRKAYLDLLLLGDEQESMIDRYLERGDMFTLCDPEVRAVCVVTDEGGGVLEVKNIAVSPAFQRRGYGSALLSFVEKQYQNDFMLLRVGTGNSPLTLPFYLALGFREVSRIPGFFTEHYDHPIFEGGRQLVDMVVLEKQFQQNPQ